MLFRHKHTVQSRHVRKGGKTVPGTGGQAFTGLGLSAASGSPVESVATLDHPAAGQFGGRVYARTPRLALAISLTAILAFVMVITLPFAGQALHIDDAIFWDFARANLENPFQEHIPNYRLMGQEYPEWRDTHPPLDQLYLAGLMTIFGSDSAPALHLGFIIFPLMTGFSLFFLARRFTKNALLAVLLLLATPAFMTMSHTLMADAPMVSFWLASTAAYIYGIDRGNNRLLALAGLMAALAVITGYQAMLLVVLLPLYALLARKLSVKTAWPVTLPLLLFGVYCLFNLGCYASLPRFQHAKGLSMEHSHLWERLQGTLLQVGGASVFPLLVAAVFSIRRKRFLALPAIAAIAIALAIHQQGHGNYPWPTTVLFAIFLTAGAAMVYAVASETVLGLANLVRRREGGREHVFLGLWMLSALGLVIILLPHATAKYTLPLLAPMVLLLFKEMEAGAPARLVKWLAVTAFALTFMTGSLVSAADYRLADEGRDFALKLPETYEIEGDIWFVGEWGFRHYMEAQGYRYLTSADESPREGDLVVRAEFSDWPLAGTVRERLQLVETSRSDWDVPLRLMNYSSGAGFYGTHWGNLPYAISSEPVERFEVFRVGP